VFLKGLNSTMGRLNYRRIFIIVGILSLLLYFIFTWMDMMADPDQRTGSDFIGFYNFGRIYQLKGIQSIYDIREQQNIEEQVVGHPVTVIFYTHMPFLAPIAKALVNEDYLASFRRWAIILLILNAINVYLLLNTLDIKKFSKDNLFLLSAAAFLFDPTFSGFMNGQDIAILLFGVIVWMWGMFNEKYFLAGLGLSLATIRPQIAIFLAIPFLFRQRQVFWGFAIGALTLAAISIGLLKMNGTLRFIDSLRYIESTIWYERHSFDMPTISGIIRRNFAVTNVALAKGFVWICYVLGIAGFSAWWYKSKEITEKHIGLMVLFGIFLLPYAHYHELTLLLIPIFCILRILQRDESIPQYYFVILPLVVSWLSALGFIGSGAMKFPIVYFIMLSLGYLLVTGGRIAQQLPQVSTQ
jgi:hypothetical protein